MAPKFGINQRYRVKVRIACIYTLGALTLNGLLNINHVIRNSGKLGCILSVIFWYVANVYKNYRKKFSGSEEYFEKHYHYH